MDFFLIQRFFFQKSIRALTLHPSLFMFASGSADNIKEWKCPEGIFIQNLSGHNAIINSLACNEDGVLVSGGEFCCLILVVLKQFSIFLSLHWHYLEKGDR